MSILLLASGCSGANGNERGPEVFGEEPRFDDLTGAIEGFVFDDEFQPVANASVELDQASRISKTTAEGRFGFNFLEPGSYSLSAHRDGYRGASTQIEVQVGISFPITLVLERLAEAKAYHQTTILGGHSGCGWNFGGFGSLLGNCGDSNQRIRFNLTGFPESWAFVVSELAWRSPGVSTNPERQYWLVWTEALGGGATADHSYGGRDGTSPVRILLEPNRTHTEYLHYPQREAATPRAGHPGPLEAVVYHGTMRVAGTPAAGFHLQWDFILYHTTFYFAPPSDPAGFTAIPDQ